MIAAWMVYGVVVGAVVGIAAAALESVLRGWGPTRWIWLSALIVSVAVPAAAIRSAGGPEATPVEFAPGADPGSELVMEALPVQRTDGGFAVPPGRVTGLPSIPMSWSRLQAPQGSLGRWASGAWILLSTFGFAWILGAGVRLRRRHSTWRPALVNGRSVLLSVNTGPAVVGLLKPDIVLPSWTVRLEETDRELMLRHEEEHRRAGDLWLVTAALGLLVCLPWNLPLWWQFRRLRLAVEVDCDHRVLGGRGDVGRYGALLLELGVSGRGRSVGAALAFARPMPFLERRIRAMTTPCVFRPLRSLTLVTLTGLLVLGACRLESPPTPSPLEVEPAPTLSSPEVLSRASALVPLPNLDPIASGPRPEPTVAPAPISVPTEIPVRARALVPEPMPVQEARRGQQAQEAAELQRLLEEIQEQVRQQESVLEEISRQFEANSASLERLRILSEQLDAVARANLGTQLDSAAVQQDRVVEQERLARERERLASLLLELARRRQGTTDSVRTNLTLQQAGVADSVQTLRIIMYDSARARQTRMGDSVRARRAQMRDSVQMLASRDVAVLRRGADSEVSGRVVGPDGTTPLPGVSVTVSAPEFEAGVVTVGGSPDGNGRFILRGVPPGERVLILQHPDYGRWQVEVEVVEGEATNVGDLVAPEG